MSDIPFHLTVMGRRFIEGTVPQILDELQELNKKIDQLNQKLDKMNEQNDSPALDVSEIENG